MAISSTEGCGVTEGGRRREYRRIAPRWKRLFVLDWKQKSDLESEPMLTSCSGLKVPPIFFSLTAPKVVARCELD